MVVPNITRASMLLRIVCGLWLVGAALATGFMMRSPWIVLPMGLAFSVLFVMGKWSAWKHAVRTTGWKSVPLGIATTVPIQCLIVALFYGLALGAAKVADSSRSLKAFETWDTNFAAIVLVLGGVLAILAHMFESRSEPDDDLLLSMLEKDGHLTEDMKNMILGGQEGGVTGAGGEPADNRSR